MAETVRLADEDLRWFRKKRRLSQESEALWQTDEFHQRYGNGWVAIAGTKVEFATTDEDALVEWLDANDPQRDKFVVRFVPPAEADFAFCGQ